MKFKTNNYLRTIISSGIIIPLLLMGSMHCGVEEYDDPNIPDASTIPPVDEKFEAMQGSIMVFANMLIEDNLISTDSTVDFSSSAQTINGTSGSIELTGGTASQATLSGTRVMRELVVTAATVNSYRVDNVIETFEQYSEAEADDENVDERVHIVINSVSDLNIRVKVILDTSNDDVEEITGTYLGELGITTIQAQDTDSTETYDVNFDNGILFGRSIGEIEPDGSVFDVRIDTYAGSFVLDGNRYQFQYTRIKDFDN